MTRSRARLAVIVTLLILAACNRKTLPEVPDDPPPSKTAIPVIGNNGLLRENRQAFYHTPEGSELIPVSWILALRQPGTDRPFLENIERFGFVRDEDPSNVTGLPIGLTSGERRGIGVPMIGINCAACHVNQIEYRETRIRIDGAPNLFDIVGFYAELKAAVEETAKPVKALEFMARLKKHPQGFHVNGTVLGEVEYIEKHSALAESYLTMLKRLSSARIDPARGDTNPGFGRADAFGTARVLLFGIENRIALDAPVGYPHLWGLNSSRWIHWNSNSNSVMQRNIGEALGLGASADPKTGESTIRLDNLHTLETLVYKIKPPEWPEALGPIRHDRAARGKALYDANCLGCHDDYGEPDAAGRFAYPVFRPDEIGTDPKEAENFAKRLNSNVSFAHAQIATLSSIEKWYYETNGISPATQAEWNNNRGPAVWRDTSEMEGRAYTAKPLAGIWATAPYLHNASVPTLFDLLSPRDQRPSTFTVGQREYDPEELGYRQSVKGPFTFDTTLPGNGNYGHEIPGTLKWTDKQKLDLLEFLKTITGRVKRGRYAPKQ